VRPRARRPQWAAKIRGTGANHLTRGDRATFRAGPDEYPKATHMATSSTLPPPPTRTDQREVRIYQHSMLFYWWPVWVIGYLMAFWTYWDGYRMAIVPPGTTIHKESDGKTYTLAVPHPDKAKALDDAAASPDHGFRLHVSENTRIGAIFVAVLLVVILITNVPLRGLWSVVVVVTIVLVSIILALANLWDDIFRALASLHIHINMAGYLFIATGLLALWVFSTFFFDRQTYMIFQPGQLKVCLEIGGGETAYDTMGMTIQKQRDDLFRHWILGLGSGDLIVRTAGAQAHEFQMHNVLNISTKLREIEDMQRERPTVQG
jgi:hypothetical protein